MNKAIVFIVVLAVIWAVPPLRAKVGSAALPVLEKLGPAGDFVVSPVRRYSAKNKVSHTLNVIENDHQLGRQPPDARGFHAWMRKRMPGESGLDPWGNEYWMNRQAGILTVGSNGPDGVAGTDDDVKSAVQF